jgi:hypothetical protein
MRRFFRAVKPYLYVVVLYIGVRWLLAVHWATVSDVVVAVPVLVGAYVYRTVSSESKRALATYRNETFFGLAVSLNGKLLEHPYMAAARATEERTREAMKAQGREDEYYTLRNGTPFGFAAGYRVLYHHGLVWVYGEKTFGEVRAQGLPFGSVLDGVDADLQPSLVIYEYLGVVSVLLVPLEQNPPTELPGEIYSRRERRNWRAMEICEKYVSGNPLSKRRINEDAPPVELKGELKGDLPVVLLAQFPVSALRTIRHVEEEFISYEESRQGEARLRELYGLKLEERDPENISGWTGWENDYVTFSFESHVD